MMRKYSFALAICAATALLSAPAMAFDTLPKLPGSYSKGGDAGGALVLGSATGGSNLTVDVKSLNGGDAGGALAIGLGGDQVVLSEGGDGGIAGTEMKAKDSAKIKLTAGALNGGRAGDALSVNLDNLDLVVPGVLDIVIK